MFGIDLNDLLFRAIAFLIAITVHEFAHAMVAYRLGDPTPKQEGRITLNPIAHMDILGTFLILFGPFGWAKPVRFNPKNFRGNKRVGMVLTTFAGPLANLITAVVFSVIIAATGLAFVDASADRLTQFFFLALNACVQMNLILFIFNLVPLPPLDGYWIVRELLPRRTQFKLMSFEKYGPFILLLLVWFHWLGPLISPAYGLIVNLINLLIGLV